MNRVFIILFIPFPFSLNLKLYISWKLNPAFFSFFFRISQSVRKIKIIVAHFCCSDHGSSNNNSTFVGVLCMTWFMALSVIFLNNPLGNNISNKSDITQTLNGQLDAFLLVHLFPSPHYQHHPRSNKTID